MNIETVKLDTVVTSILLHDKHKEIIDVDEIFRQTNRDFAGLLVQLGLPMTFDFNNRSNKRLYTHQFITTLCEFLKNRTCEYTPYFYNNTLTKDKFRIGLMKKIKAIFGFLIWDDRLELSSFASQLEEQNCDNYAFEIFLDSFKKPKSFKHIKKYTEKAGLVFMNEVYLEDLSNKMLIFR